MRRKRQNLYLHFLDRELRESVGHEISEDELLLSMLAAVCLTPGRLFCSYSHLWESNAVFGGSLYIIQEMIRADELVPASDYHTSDEFLASRDTLYHHDIERYPFYFDPKVAKKLGAIQPGHATRRGATRDLETFFLQWLDKPSGEMPRDLIKVAQMVSGALKTREGRAITKKLFSEQPGADVSAIHFVQRSISREYTRHYMIECDSDILTGVPGLVGYDEIALSFPYNDVRLLRFLMSVAGPYPRTTSELRLALEHAFAARSLCTHREFLAVWNGLIESLPADSGGQSTAIGNIIAELKERVGRKKFDGRQRFSLETLTEVLENIRRLSKDSQIINNGVNMAKKILFLAANPSGSIPLNLDDEAREIDQRIRAATHRDLLDFHTKWAVRPADLLTHLNDYKPHIVHFSGHGSTSEELILKDNNGQPKPVSKEALIQLFSTLKDNIRVVVLNACFSRPQAEAITEVVDCAIGMTKAIGDQAAITFAAAFYQAIAYGRSVREAFESGKAALMLEGIAEEKTPELLVRRGVDPAAVHIIDPKL